MQRLSTHGTPRWGGVMHYFPMSYEKQRMRQRNGVTQEERTRQRNGVT